MKIGAISRMTGSIPFNDKKGCPAGYHKRTAYTSKLGHRVSPRCVKSTTVYTESHKNYTRRVLAKQQARLKNAGKDNAPHIKCPPGEIERRGYVRRFDAEILQKGYTVKRRTGKGYRIQPKKANVYVKPVCVKDRGLVGKLNPGEGFGPIRKGELKKHGYVYLENDDKRKAAIKSAIGEFGALGVFRKLDVIAKLSLRTNPDAHAVFKEDRDWLKAHYKLKAP